MSYSVFYPLSSLTAQILSLGQFLRVMTYFKAVLWESASGNHRTTILPEKLSLELGGIVELSYI